MIRRSLYGGRRRQASKQTRKQWHAEGDLLKAVSISRRSRVEEFLPKIHCPWRWCTQVSPPRSPSFPYTYFPALCRSIAGFSSFLVVSFSSEVSSSCVKSPPVRCSVRCSGTWKASSSKSFGPSCGLRISKGTGSATIDESTMLQYEVCDSGVLHEDWDSGLSLLLLWVSLTRGNQDDSLLIPKCSGIDKRPHHSRVCRRTELDLCNDAPITIGQRTTDTRSELGGNGGIDSVGPMPDLSSHHEHSIL